jgi:AAA domain
VLLLAAAGVPAAPVLTFRTVLIWLNGPHGVGKTQTAFELHRRLPGSSVCDPEHLSIGLRRMLPQEMGGDARVRALWRAAVSDVLAMVLDQRDGGDGRAGDDAPVIAPMTVFDPDALKAILDPLRAAGHEVLHVTLLASRDVVRRRMRSRLESPRGVTGRRIDEVLDALQAPEFARHLRTDGMSIGAVADAIAAQAGLTLEPDNTGPLGRRARRIAVQLRNVRNI